MMFIFNFNPFKVNPYRSILSGFLSIVFLYATHFVNAAEEDYCTVHPSDLLCTADELVVTGYQTDSDFYHFYNLDTPAFFPKWSNLNSDPMPYQGPVNNYVNYSSKSVSLKLPLASTIKENVLAQSTSSNSVEHTCHPVTISTGSKFLDELDFQDVGDNPLKIDRHYTAGTYGIFGYGWTTSMDDRLDFAYQEFITMHSQPPLPPLTYKVENGPPIHCRNLPGLYAKSCSSQLQDIAGPPATDHSFAPDPVGISLNHSAQLTKFGSAPGIGQTIKTYYKDASLSRPDASTWKVSFQNGDVEIFNNLGLPISKVDVNGIGWVFTYDGTNLNRLISVTHTSGRKLVFG